MKSSSCSVAILAVGLLFITNLATLAADPPAPTPSAGVADQKAAYPLPTCVVSSDKLDEMGPPLEYTYKEAGKPDRLVLFCCKDCVADFEKAPAKYLKKIDDAAALAAKSKK